MATKQNDSLVTVFKGEIFEAEVVKGLLESSGIPSMIENKSLSAILSTYSYVSGSVRVLVNPSDQDAAKKLLDRKNDQNS